MTSRVVADGKHLALGGAPFRVHGSTYGSFVARPDGELYPERTQIKCDLAAMAEAGLNTVRTYTLPPPELIEVAGELGMRVLVGLHYRDWREELEPGRSATRRILDAGRRAVDAAMDRCAADPAVLAVAVGNEVPADVIRVHGIGTVEETLAKLVSHVHDSDTGMLATYCNFPSTEYLQVEGLDLVCFNVFLEQRDALRRYLRHLQVVAHEIPLVVSELGLASEVHGQAAQADVLRWQLETVDEVGCAGATVFSWTDEWGVAGESVEGWGFGITATDRRPKPALEVVSAWARSSLGDLRERWPSIAVVVCAYNEERTIHECLRSLRACDYPNLEVIVCDDGSQDRTVEIAGNFPFRVLGLSHQGLSAARNAGLAVATGDIVAYLDADASCHHDWPYHLALSLEDDSVVATGGPNLPVADAGLVERAVAASPGGPVHVLISDDRAEHVPGCNMAFRKHALEEVGGFDAVYTSAGDDVDVCWKLLDRGYDIGFAASAQVRHHRRSTVGGYLRQQRGYGRAERMLSGPHRHRFNRLGQARWRGSIYTRHVSLGLLLRPVVYHGWLGSAPFQPVDRRPAQALLDWAAASIPVGLLLMVLTAVVGIAARPALGVAAVLAGLVATYAVVAGRSTTPERHETSPRTLRVLVGFLHVAQPLARVAGRVRARPVPARASVRPAWTGERLVWLESFERQCAGLGCSVRPGRPCDPWDLEVSVGPLLRCRFSAAIVWQWTRLHKCRLRPRPTTVIALLVAAGIAALGPLAALAVPAVVVVAVMIEATVLRSVIRRGLERSSPAEAAADNDDEVLEIAG